METSLLQRVAEGDTTAVQACIDRYGGLVASLARRMLGARNAEVEDAVQEIFIELWRVAGRYDPSVSSEASFVTMITRRRLIDRRRRSSSRPSLEGIPEEALPEPSADPGELAARGDEAARAAAAVRTLRPEQQKVLLLNVYHGWPHAQIAEHLQLPLGTVKAHVRRGLMRVREMLGTGAPLGAGGVAS